MNSIEGRTYDQQVQDLVKNCEELECNYYFIERPEFAQKGMYQRAIGYKPQFILEALDIVYPKKAIYIDTDLYIQKYPYLFEVDADFFGINYFAEDPLCYNLNQLWLPGGLMGFANNDIGRGLLDMFISNLDVNKLEDKVIGMLFTENYLASYVRCMWLPSSYLLIFSHHDYDLDKMEYSYIPTLQEEADEYGYDAKDIVIFHPDSETGEMGWRIIKSGGELDDPWPEGFYDAMGLKLRCMNNPKIKYHLYTNFNLNPQQEKHMSVVYKDMENSGTSTLKQMPKLKDLDYEFEYIEKYFYFEFGTPFIVISLVDKQTDSLLDDFIESCKNEKINFTIFRVDKISRVNKPVIIRKQLVKYKQPVVYLDISYRFKDYPDYLYVENMDFMAFNLNNDVYDEIEQKSRSKCVDPRVLYLINSDLLYFNYTQPILNFLILWINYNTKKVSKRGYDHKTLEYTFNVASLESKLRCFWLPIEYVYNPSIKYSEPPVIESEFGKIKKGYSKLLKRYKEVRWQSEQCGYRPPYEEDYVMSREHFRRGIYTNERNDRELEKYFLEY